MSRKNKDRNHFIRSVFTFKQYRSIKKKAGIVSFSCCYKGSSGTVTVEKIQDEYHSFTLRLRQCFMKWDACQKNISGSAGGEE